MGYIAIYGKIIWFLLSYLPSVATETVPKSMGAIMQCLLFNAYVSKNINAKKPSYKF